MARIVIYGPVALVSSLSYLMRNPEAKKDVWENIKIVMAEIKDRF